MNIICLSSDLMMTSKISSLAKLRGIACSIVPQVEQLTEGSDSLENDSDRSLWLIDLQRCGDDFESIVTKANEAKSEVTLIGYAQHVHPEILDAATAAGFVTVLTRGKFDRQVGSIIEQFAGTDS